IGLFISVVIAFAYSCLLVSKRSRIAFKTEILSAKAYDFHLNKEHSKTSNVVWLASVLMANVFINVVKKMARHTSYQNLNIVILYFFLPSQWYRLATEF